MAIKPADMESCSPKSRCLSGPNKGLAYDAEDPCTPGKEFNEFTCECDTYATSWGICARYINACSGQTLCRCQVLAIDSRGAPATITAGQTGNSTCATGDWSIAFTATFDDNSTQSIPIASGVSARNHYLDSYEIVYDVPTGGYSCDTAKATGRVRQVLVSATNLREDQSTPGRVIAVADAPYFDGQGRLITETLALAAAYTPPGFTSECIGELGYVYACEWVSSNSMTKTAQTCSGGGTSAFNSVVITKTNGANTNWSSQITYMANGESQCGSTAGASFAMTVKYEEEISPGVWVPYG